MGTVVLTGKISLFIYFFFVNCVYVDVDRKLSFFPPFCTLCLLRNVSISHISKHAQLSRRSGLDNMGPDGYNLFSNYFNSVNFGL